jgi:hypothetical protein
MSAEAEWCGQCYAVRASTTADSAATFVPAPPANPLFATPSGGLATGVPVRAAPVKTEAPPTIKTRWRKTPTTFGPVGRLTCTVGLVLMLAFFIVGGIITGGMTLVGAGIWGFVIMPWALRDLWKAGTLPAP